MRLQPRYTPAPSPFRPLHLRFVALFLGVSALAAAVAACGSLLMAQAGHTVGRPAPASAQPKPLRLAYVTGTAQRVEQLIGDVDDENKQPTLNQTARRYGIRGTDLGNSFDFDGKTYFLFGDTLGSFDGDVVGVTSSTDPDGPLALDFLTDAQGHYLKVEPNDTAMGPYDVPVSGIGVNGQMYVVVKTGYVAPAPGEGFGGASMNSFSAVLTRFDPATNRFVRLRVLSQLPEGRFITTTLRLAPDGMPGLPTAQPYVLMFGSGQYRRSDAYLAAVPAASFESGDGTVYYAGMSDGGPLWSPDEADATPIIDHPTIGDISVSYVPELDRWISLYDSRQPRGIVLRYSPTPWGPWSEPQVVFDPRRDPGYGVFIHSPFGGGDDGLGGPVIGEGRDPTKVAGGIYAPYIIERFTRVQDGRLDLQFVLSTWNPYTVVRMRTQLYIEH